MAVLCREAKWDRFDDFQMVCLICLVITVKKLKSLWGSFWLNKEIHDLAKSKKCKSNNFFRIPKSMSSILCKCLEPIIHVDVSDCHMKLEILFLNEDLWSKMIFPQPKTVFRCVGTEAKIILKLEIWIIDVVWLFGSKRKYH